MNRGDVHAYAGRRRAQGHEQGGPRLVVIVQDVDLLPLATAMVVPTSTVALASTFRPRITVGDVATRALVDHVSAIDPQRLGERAGTLDRDELEAVERSLRLVLGLR